MVVRLSRRDARRLALRAQLLTVERPSSIMDVFRRLTLIQVDLTAAVAPNVDLVLWSRLGAAFEPEELDRLVETRALVEFRAMLRPAEDIALFRDEMRHWPGRGQLRDWQIYEQEWVRANERCRDDILQRLQSEGPLAARDLPDTCAVSWRSTGWTNNKNVMKMLEFLERRGEVAVSSREGRERVWDLAERIYPDVPAIPVEEAKRIRFERRLATMGLARATGPESPTEDWFVGDIGEEAVVEGVRGKWRVDAAQLHSSFRGRAALLSPLDRVVFDRKRVQELFEYDYQLEMYKPAAKRRWGYFALPILYGDRLVGKLDATSDFEAGVLRINARHEDEPFTKTMNTAVDREVRSLARLLELTPQF